MNFHTSLSWVRVGSSSGSNLETSATKDPSAALSPVRCQHGLAASPSRRGYRAAVESLWSPVSSSTIIQHLGLQMGKNANERYQVNKKEEYKDKGGSTFEVLVDIPG